jgi:hypothetical protein
LQGDARGPLDLLADRAPMNAQLGTDLEQGPALTGQVGCTLNVRGVTVTSLGPVGLLRCSHAESFDDF